MRGLLVGVTVAVALIVGVLVVALVHAEGPKTTEGEALAAQRVPIICLTIKITSLTSKGLPMNPS